ncbi:DUF692 domain-containing protein [Pyxidicoccus parkwayensis]|uniref:DUF692 domain-containing protein n=1 Tax=Pyxidicoccus parkwayensis TaxID=2813578 RepID=A0ABX7P9J1_9BACT|nr:DUF692 domain-containing protein [Pyxidicoccus parkwaysis]QSQ27160.1 DUF692 domain-containing protein [Pyxidicoccus parkwaysis]
MSSIPFLGVGLSYRWDFQPHLARGNPGVDWLEVMPEHFFPLTEDTVRRLEVLAKRFPLAGHGLELSVGSDGVDGPDYVASLKRMLATTRAAWHSDHLCFTRAGELPVRSLTPVPFTEDALETCVRNIRRVKAELGLPFIVENIAWLFDTPLSTLDEADFLTRVVTQADCGLLLDLHNVYANAVNHKFDPYAFVDRLPLDRVVQIHLAGGVTMEGVYVDSHSNVSPEEVWRLLEYVAPRCPVRGVNFEMDSGFPPFARLVEELARARAILERCGASAA